MKEKLMKPWVVFAAIGGVGAVLVTASLATAGPWFHRGHRNPEVMRDHMEFMLVQHADGLVRLIAGVDLKVPAEGRLEGEQVGLLVVEIKYADDVLVHGRGQCAVRPLRNWDFS